jgi:predicted membrane protein
MDILTKKQENFCENTGLFGVMTATACLLQHLFFMIPTWITFSIIPVYILSIIGFVLLMKKTAAAFRVLFISTILVFLLEAFMIISLAFSLVLLILLLYMVVIVTLLYMDEIAQQLKRKNFAEQEEAAQWDNIL